MAETEVVKVEKVYLTNKETGKTYEFTPDEVMTAMEEHLENSTCCEDCEFENECMKESIKDAVVGSTLKSIDDELCLVYLDEQNNGIASTNLMPDIINVQKPNDETVFVEFADGSKEVAHLSEGDTFSLETGILICVVKKIFSDMDIIGTGSSVYNKVIKYALTKLDYTKKARKKALEQQKAMHMAVVKAKQDARRAENKAREERIREMTEAYKRAINNVSEEASKDLKRSVEDFLTELEKELQKEIEENKE